MRNRLKITEPKYIINYKDKVVVCILKCNTQVGKHPTWYYISSCMWKRLPLVDLQGCFKVVGIARCSSEDVFNEEQGRKIAESRAKIKAFTTAAKVYKEIEKCFLNCAALADETGEACDHAVEVEKKHLETLIG